MSREYLRKVALEVADGAKNSYLLSDMRIQFNVVSATVSSLKYAEITVWNLNREKANKILKEFVGVSLSAGYEGSYGLIFNGQIARVETGKENAVDSYVRIFAQDGDHAKNWTMTNTTLKDGWTDEDLYQQLMTDFERAGLEAGYNPGLDVDTRGARGFPLYAQTAQIMNGLAHRQGCDWFIEDGKVNLVPNGGTLPGPMEVLTPASGLIGVPKLTIGGINVRCLLNPKIRTGARIQIDNKLVAQLNQQTPFLNDVGAVVPDMQGQPDGNGIYKAHSVTHTGDTRGQEWYTNTIGVSIDSLGPPAGAAFYDVPDAI